MAAKSWETPTPIASPISATSPLSSPKPSVQPVNSKIRSGIVGIERSIEEQHRATDASITVAFQDLRKLMEKAKDMVAISKNISTKIRVCKCINSSSKQIMMVLKIFHIQHYFKLIGIST